MRLLSFLMKVLEGFLAAPVPEAPGCFPGDLVQEGRGCFPGDVGNDPTGEAPGEWAVAEAANPNASKRSCASLIPMAMA
jgi:hypothetical protein